MKDAEKHIIYIKLYFTRSSGNSLGDLGSNAKGGLETADKRRSYSRACSGWVIFQLCGEAESHFGF